MSTNTAPQIDIVRLEDKETKLKSFITKFIETQSALEKESRLATTGQSSNDQVLLLVLRSLDSPVAKAVTTLFQERVLDMPVRAVIAIVTRSELDNGVTDASPFTAANTVQLSRDLRLLDVHEQLVLGPAASWVGDCMRRDPRKRDAYECYAVDNRETAQWARISFDRLWQKGEPISVAAPAGLTTAAEASAAMAGEAANELPSIAG
jgi:hypothetical protein